jgi:hypothetical protein
MDRAALLADDPVWLILIKVVVVLLIGPIMTVIMIVAERKVMGRMQQRPGPNRVGPSACCNPSRTRSSSRSRSRSSRTARTARSTSSLR